MEFSDLDSKEQDLVNYIRSKEGAPFDMEAAAKRMGMNVSRLDRTMYRLSTAKVISSRIKGGQRFVEAGPPPEPKRAYRVECPRCGIVNCTAHTASRLTNGRVRPGSPMRF